MTEADHVADYGRRTDVSGSEFAFHLGGKQARYLMVTARSKEKIELVKGRDNAAPIAMAVTGGIEE